LPANGSDHQRTPCRILRQARSGARHVQEPSKCAGNGMDCRKIRQSVGDPSCNAALQLDHELAHLEQKKCRFVCTVESHQAQELLVDADADVVLSPRRIDADCVVVLFDDWLYPMPRARCRFDAGETNNLCLRSKKNFFLRVGRPCG